MADETILIENTVNVFAPEPTEKWGAMIWGADNWAYGTEDLAVNVGKYLTNAVLCAGASYTFDAMKLVANAQASDTALTFDVMKMITNAQASDTALFFDVMKLVANSQASTWDVLRFDVMKLVASSQASTTALSFDVRAFFNFGTFSILTNPEIQYLTSGGWYYIFQGNVANSDDRESTTFTEATAGSTSWSSSTAGSTTWTEE